MMRTTKTLSEPERAAWARLQRARPTVEWHKASARGADFVGDGSVTLVMVGTDDDGGGWVGIVPPGREGPRNPAVFAVARSIGLSFERLERADAWLHEGVFPFAGCRPRRGMKLLRVVDTATGVATLYYWNAQARCIDAWSAAAPAAAGAPGDTPAVDGAPDDAPPLSG